MNIEVSAQRLQDIGLDRSRLLDIYESMVRIRKFEEKVGELYRSGRLPGFVHLYIGEEAVGVGVCSNLRVDDHITSTHRAEGHCLAKGMSSNSVMAELMGKVDGCCKGKGGSMHFADASRGMMGATGIVGSLIPAAVGAGLSAQVRHTDQVAVAFFGDGGVPNGAFHESINLAAAWNLPVVFVCENNLFSTWTPFKTVSKNPDVVSRAEGYGLPGFPVDGMDVLEVYKAAHDAVMNARNGGGPTLLECKTYRYVSHHAGDSDPRTREEKEVWLNKDPIRKLAQQLTNLDIASSAQLSDIDKRMTEEVLMSIEFGEKSPFPPVEEAVEDLFHENNPRLQPPPSDKGERQISLRESVNEAMMEEMRRDERIIVYGQGYMGSRGGPFQVGKGLQDAFGRERVRDAPISELALAGVALGAAMTGLRPVIEIQYVDWLTLSMDQLVNHIAKTTYMFGGQFSVPLVLRSVVGAFTNGGPHHSQSLEAWFMHVPGLKVIMPSTPFDTKGLLKTAIRDGNPCLFFEAKALYPLKGPVPKEEYEIPLGQADIKKVGKDITIITWSRMVHVALSAAQKLQSQGIDAEVIDLRTLVPLDKKTVIESVKKTGKALLVYEAYKSASAGSEVAAILAEEAFNYLEAPIVRVANPGYPVPFSPPLESYILPNDEKVVQAAQILFSSTKK